MKTQKILLSEYRQSRSPHLLRFSDRAVGMFMSYRFTYPIQFGNTHNQLITTKYAILHRLTEKI